MAFAVGGLDTQQIRVGLLGQQRRVGHGAGREDARDFALNRAFARGGIADLFANRDRFAQLQQFGQILLGGVVGHARHFDRLAIGRAARSQCDAEQTRRFDRIVEEQFVKIAHAVKQQSLRELGLDRQILRHHRRDFGRRF